MKLNCLALILHRGINIFPVFLIILLPVALAAQDYTYTINDGNVTITAYTGAGGDVTVPDTIEGQQVTAIGPLAFSDKISLTSVVIGNSVTSIGIYAFYNSTSLTEVTIGNGVTTMDDYVFSGCSSLAKVKIGNGITSVGNLTFYYCASPLSLYFEGNAPNLGSSVFLGADKTTVYYLPDALGWGSTFGERPTVLWDPQIPVGDIGFNAEDGLFEFSVTSISDLVVLVQACADLANPEWLDLEIITLRNGVAHFSDPDSISETTPSRFYRLRMP